MNLYWSQNDPDQTSTDLGLMLIQNHPLPSLYACRDFSRLQVYKCQKKKKKITPLQLFKWNKYHFFLF